jgi:hypothetical protein
LAEESKVGAETTDALKSLTDSAAEETFVPKYETIISAAGTIRD